MSSITVIEKNEARLSWMERVQYFEEMKNPLLREEAVEKYVNTFQSQIQAIARKSIWGNRWGYEDAYQHAITFVLEKAIAANDPSELPRRWDICNAIKEEAANQIYTISLSPYLIKTHGYSSGSFDRESIVPDQSSGPKIFDELTWRRIRKLAEDHLEPPEQRILMFYMEVPGRVPPIDEIAERLSLKLETAKRYIRWFKQRMREIPELAEMYHDAVGLNRVEQPVKEPPRVAIASDKDISITHWRREKIRQVSQSTNTSSLCLMRAQKMVILQEDMKCFLGQSSLHPTVSFRCQHRDNILFKALHKPLQFSECLQGKTLKVRSKRVLRGRPWNDWNSKVGDRVA